MAENKLADMSTEFAVKILNVTGGIKGHYSLANQLERSGTSIGANIREAKYAHRKGERKMNDNFMLESEQFSLSLDFQVFESDIEYPSNTILSVCVSSSGFSAATTMDIDIKAVRDFCNELENIYNTLKGSTKIQEAYGKQCILFSGDGLGHIMVSGFLDSQGANGFWQELKFENCIDQTYFPSFLKGLANFTAKFKK